MYFTRFGYFVIFSIIGVAAAAVLLIVWPFGSGDEGGGGDGSAVVATATAPAATPEPTPSVTPSLSFEQVVNFARAGALVDIVVTGEAILVNFNPAFDTSGLGTNSHAFVTTLPPGQNSVEEALRQNGVAVGGDDGVPVIRQ